MNESLRELDAKIAEQVFGRVRCRGEYHRKHDGMPHCFAHPNTPTMGAENPRFSSDISAAFQVVEAMRAQGHEITMRATKLGFRVEIAWLVDGEAPEGGFFSSDREYVSDCESLPLAICQCALQAIAAERALIAPPVPETPDQ